jgi:lipopolysaccharide export system ATP-binding protein
VKKRKAVKKAVKKVSVVDSSAHEAREIPFFPDDSIGLQSNNDATANLQAASETSAQHDTPLSEPEAWPAQENLSATGQDNHPRSAVASGQTSSLAHDGKEIVAQATGEAAVMQTNGDAPIALALKNGKVTTGQVSILGAEGLRKSYRKRTVVHNVSLEIKQNEIVGLLGPNGAGKTTIFYMIVGLEKPDKGKIYLNAKDISRLPMYLRARNGISYLPQEASVFRKLTVEENILLVLQTMPLTKREREHKLETLLDELDIEYVRHTKAYQLSGGERRRTEIARCLVIEPRFILLDEPFAGIDPIAVIDIQKILQKLRERGIGVLITDHNVRETLAITDRAYIINEGQIFRAGTPDALTRDEEVRRVYLGENFRM